MPPVNQRDGMIIASQGLVAVRIGGSPDALLDEVHQEVHDISLVKDDDGLRTMAEALVLLTQGRTPVTPLPLDVQGTDFQLRVWGALQQIPAGEVRTYGEVADHIGSPKAVRAVGGACGANPVALVIPCHRVVRADGDLGEYRWGRATKRALLDLEA